MTDALLERLALGGLRHLSSAGAILCYHSLTSPELPAESTIHVSLEAFRADVSLVRRWGRLVSISELLRRHHEGRSTAGLVALTFDDGYAALPALLTDFLEREEVPIAVFAVTDALRSGAAFWWDRIEDFFPHVPAARWREFEDSCGLPEEYRRGQAASLEPLRPFRQWILATHTGRLPARIDALLAELEEETRVRTAHRSMTWEELTRFAASPWVEVGVHTLSHPVLPFLPDEEWKQEVHDCYLLLRERIPDTLPVLSIPYGFYDERSIRLARELGMSTSLTLKQTTMKGCEPGGGLPRFCITRGGARWKLALRLSGFFGEARIGPDGQRAYPDLPSPTT
ncbi:MAG: polysaccharide deacetylase family protein [Gemmatimonadetes bacterium]|nr:polysaccharide deacetylase family protein [Gemmatimonadota bacterium]